MLGFRIVAKRRIDGSLRAAEQISTSGPPFHASPFLGAHVFLRPCDEVAGRAQGVRMVVAFRRASSDQRKSLLVIILIHSSFQSTLDLEALPKNHARFKGRCLAENLLYSRYPPIVHVWLITVFTGYSEVQ